MLPSSKISQSFTFVFAAVLFIATAADVRGQFLKLRDFGGTEQGANPYDHLVSDGTFLYGTAQYGGSAAGYGTIYRVLPDGSDMTVLHYFDDLNGSHPHGALLLDGGALYGMTINGGDFGQGVIYKINPDGTGYTKLFDFHYGPTGGFPIGALITDGSVLYGVTTQGGAQSAGTVFKINKDGTGHTLLHEFANTDGYYPQGELAFDGSFLYGITMQGGANGLGTIYKVKTDGSGFQTLLEFDGTAHGEEPLGSLFYDGSALWGMTHRGGSSSLGLVFRIGTDGTGYSKMDFDGTNGSFPKGGFVGDGTFIYGTTSFGGATSNGIIFRIEIADPTIDFLENVGGGMSGSQPEGTLTLVGTTLFGMTSTGGYSSLGNIYKLNTNGSQFQQIYSFEKTGAEPGAALVSDGNFLYGITGTGGLYNHGTIYKIAPNGTGFERLLDFDNGITGARPLGSLFLSGGILYGTTSEGGANNLGTLFKIGADGSGFQKLLDFDGTNNGGVPVGGLITDGADLFGVTSIGGANGYGTIFRIQPDGSNYAKLYEFDYTTGGYPQGDLLLDAGTLYGLASQGGVDGAGVAFKIDTDGSNFKVLHEFAYTLDGGYPKASFSADVNYLYATTSGGGANTSGTIFRMKRDGTGFESLYSFDAGASGGGPTGSLIFADSFLFGVTPYGGTAGKGTMFQIQPDGTGFAKLVDFNDGEQANGTLFSDGEYLFGVTTRGGVYSFGTMFRKPVAASLQIVDFTPIEGAAGTYVTINGNGFSTTPATNKVKFNGFPATVVSSTANEIVAIVPPDATTGKINVSIAGLSDTSLKDFTLKADSEMFDGKVQTCQTVFIEPGSSDDMTQTFIPGTAGGKIKVTFSEMTIDDQLLVYDGPDINSPLIKTLSSSDNTFTYTSTAPGGELTFKFIWDDASSYWTADIECDFPNGSITIDQQPVDAESCQNMLPTMSVTASGTTLSYQWQYSTDGSNWSDIQDGSNYSGVTTSTLQVNTASNFGAGFYRCHLNGGGISVDSDAAELTVVTCSSPAISTKLLTTVIHGDVTFDLAPLLSDVDNDLDLQSLKIVQQPQSGAVASLNGTVLTIAYSNSDFSGKDVITIEVCDLRGNCATQLINIDVAGDLVVYNAVSPNGDGKNDVFFLEYIDIIPTTKDNTVKIYNRWGDEVFSVSNYNNTDRVFRGENKNGNRLPSGTYYYKISFNGNSKDLNGYLDLKN